MLLLELNDISKLNSERSGCRARLIEFLCPFPTYCWQWAWPWLSRMIQSGWRWHTGTFPRWKTPHYVAAGWSYTLSPPSRLQRLPALADAPGCGSLRRSGPRCLSSKRMSWVNRWSWQPSRWTSRWCPWGRTGSLVALWFEALGSHLWKVRKKKKTNLKQMEHTC